MATVADIIEQAETQAEESYDEATWLRWVNQCLDDLTPVAKHLKIKEGIALAVSNGKATLLKSSEPDLSKAHEILNVYFTQGTGTMEQLKKLPAHNNYSKGYKETYDSLIFQSLSTSGTIRVDFYKRINSVTTTSETPELPPEYHPLIILYCAAKAQQKEEELNDKNDFYAEYLKGKASMAIDRVWQMEPSNRKYIRKARIAALMQQGG